MCRVYLFSTMNLFNKESGSLGNHSLDSCIARKSCLISGIVNSSPGILAFLDILSGHRVSAIDEIVGTIFFFLNKGTPHCIR